VQGDYFVVQLDVFTGKPLKLSPAGHGAGPNFPDD
jgi:hypothetical protein